MGQLYHLFLIQFICGLVFCEPDNHQLNNIILQVSEYGLDVPSCILVSGNNPRPCKTLTHVLGQISTSKFYNNTSIAININSNQTISLQHTYHFNLTVTLDVEVVGHNGTFINFKKNSLLEICGSDSYISWTWASIGLGFMRSYGDQLVDSTGLVLIQKRLSFLATFKVKVLSISWHIIDTPTVVISYTYFGQDNNVFCPLLSLTFGNNFDLPDNVATFNLFKANNFSFCQMSDAKDRLVILKINLKNYHTTFELLNNTFTGLDHYPGAPLLWVCAVKVETNSVTKTLIENNRFNRNTIGMLGIHFDCEDTTSEYDQQAICFTEVLMENNYFQHNYYTRKLLNVHISTSTSESDLVLRKIFFIGNHQNSLTVLTIFSVAHIVIEELHLIDNENTASQKLFSIDGARSINTNVKLAKLLIKNNVVSTIEPIKPPDELQQAVISLSSIYHLLFTDSTFINNSGTSFIITDNVIVFPAALQLEGNIVFYNNTGLFGGACALRNIAVDTRGTGKIVFENNVAIYGGALYFDSVLLPRATSCNLVLNFYNNKATTAGNIAYFGTSPPKNIFQTLSCNVTLEQRDKNFGSLTRNIIESENRSVLTVIPGQNIYMNVSIKDYFGYPSSCIADMYILCDNSLYNCFRKQIALIGPNSVLLAQVTFGITLDTNVRLSAPKDLNNTLVSIVFTCRNEDQTSTKVNLNISTCPLGFVYNSSERVCKCAKVTKNHGTVICSESLGISCIKQGYWYGPLNTSNSSNESSMIYVSAPCSFPQCI